VECRLPDLKRVRLPTVVSLFPARYARGDGGQLTDVGDHSPRRSWALR
jgi:hypothetical protein